MELDKASRNNSYTSSIAGSSHFNLFIYRQAYVYNLPLTLVGELPLSLLLGMALGLLLINIVQSPCLDLAVDECANHTGEDLLCASVLCGLAWNETSR